MANVKVVWPKLYIWPLTLKNDLDLILLPLKMCSLVRCTCTPNIKCLSLLDQMLWPKWKWTFLPIYLTFDLEGWPWPWQITPQNVRLEEMHMHAKYQVSICNGSKVKANVKVVLKQTDKQINKQTNRQTDKQTGQKQYAPQILSGGHKNTPTSQAKHTHTHTDTHIPPIIHQLVKNTRKTYIK